MPRYSAIVQLYDLDKGKYFGDSWEVEVTAKNRLEAAREIRRKAWDDVDTRMNDVGIELVSVPKRV